MPSPTDVSSARKLRTCSQRSMVRVSVIGVMKWQEKTWSRPSPPLSKLPVPAAVAPKSIIDTDGRYIR